MVTRVEMRGAFMSRRGHPLARRRRPITFDDMRCHPITSIPFSDEVARVLVELKLTPSFESTARFGRGTLSGRSRRRPLSRVRRLMEQLLRD